MLSRLGTAAAWRTRSTRRMAPWPAPALPIAALLIAFGVAACSPTVRVEAPDEPIEINLNVRIEQEVLIRIERDVEDLLDTNDDIF